MIPINITLTDKDQEELVRGRGLSEKMLHDQARYAAYFYRYFEDKSEKTLPQLFKREDGREKISEIFGDFFNSSRIKGGECPKKGYACTKKSTINK